MRSITAHRPRRILGITGTILGGALALGLAAPALALEAPTEPSDSATATRSAATSFTSDLQTEIFIGEKSRPSDFVASPDGAWGYATGDELNEFVIIDMAKREVTQRIPIPGTGAEYVRVTADGSRAYFSLTQGTTSIGIGVVDLTTGTLFKVITGVSGNIQEIVLSEDGSSVYALDLSPFVARFDTATGEELARLSISGMNAHGMVLINDDSQLLVGRGDEIITITAESLEQVGSVQIPKVSSLASLRVDSTDSRVYFADSSGTTLGIFDPSTGEVIARAAVGSPMHETVGYDGMNRAFGDVPYWDMLMAADFNTGKRSESVRVVPNAPFSIKKNPVTGEILSANGGWSNAAKGSTVTIVNTPSVTDPSDVEVSALGETVRFETEAVGIKRGHGGGVTWQSSSDGETWTDIEGAKDEQLDVLVTTDNMRLLYRASWYDDFWGQSGSSASAKILTPAPAITFEGPLEDGTVGSAYPSTVITATGQDDLVWSIAEELDVAGLPAGMKLNPETGTISGTPTAAGTYEVTVRVTDVFGEDTHAYPLTVLTAGGPTDPTDPVDPTDPLDPKNPGGPNNPGTPADGGKGSGNLSATGSTSPLVVGLLAAGILTLGAGGVLLARKRGTREI